MNKKLMVRLAVLFAFVVAISAAVIYFTVDIRTLEYLTMFEPRCILLALGCLTAASAEATAVPAAQSPESGLQTLVDEGLISQETLTAIMNYMKENQPAMPDGQQSGGNPPAMPDGQQSGGDPPAMPDGQQPGVMLSQTLLSDLLNAGILTQDEYDAILASDLVSTAAASLAPGGNPPAGGPGASAANVTYTAATEITVSADLTGGSYASETSDENAILIDTDEAVSLTDPTVAKTGDSDGGDSCSFYGLNAAVLVKGGANVTITGGTITTDASGANGGFSYGGNGGQNGADGDGTTVTLSGTTITTTGDGSGGIMTTGGGVTHASNLTIETSGRSSAAIRTDRGGGTVTVDGGSYTTNGLGSPAIYSTADIDVANATLVSKLSEGVCIEGKNSITLTDCDLTADNTRCNGNATFLDSIMIYQSMSGDADTGTSAFTMTGGSLTSTSGHVFHVTNTHAVITLNGVAITNEDADGVLLSVCDDGWNGGNNHAELAASAQTLEGAVLVGDNATLTMTLTDGTAFTGCITGDIQNSQGATVSTQVGEVSVSLDGTSIWTLTADSYITAFSGSAEQVVANGFTLYVNGVALTGTR